MIISTFIQYPNMEDSLQGFRPIHGPGELITSHNFTDSTLCNHLGYSTLHTRAGYLGVILHIILFNIIVIIGQIHASVSGTYRSRHSMWAYMRHMLYTLHGSASYIILCNYLGESVLQGKGVPVFGGSGIKTASDIPLYLPNFPTNPFSSVSITKKISKNLFHC